MAKKDLGAIDTGKKQIGTETGEVYAAIERGKNTYRAQPTASAEEQAERMKDGRTQGRKGCKQQRINVAFTSANYEFVKVVSKIKGQTMTQFINYCLEQYRADHPDLYEAAKTVIAMAAAANAQNGEEETQE